MEEAIEWVLSGGCIVYPTSTLPALGCIPDSNALDRLYAIKVLLVPGTPQKVEQHILHVGLKKVLEARLMNSVVASIYTP